MMRMIKLFALSLFVMCSANAFALQSEAGVVNAMYTTH